MGNPTRMPLSHTTTSSMVASLRLRWVPSPISVGAHNPRTGRGTKDLAEAVMSFLEEQRAREAHAREEPAGDTIIVDTGALKDDDLGDLDHYNQPEGPVRRSQRLRHSANSAIEGPPIPKTYAEAMGNPTYKAYWEQAISEELTKLQALNTWKYVKLPPKKKAISCKWVFTVKYTPTSLIN